MATTTTRTMPHARATQLSVRSASFNTLPVTTVLFNNDDFARLDPNHGPDPCAPPSPSLVQYMKHACARQLDECLLGGTEYVVAWLSKGPCHFNRVSWYVHPSSPFSFTPCNLDVASHTKRATCATPLSSPGLCQSGRGEAAQVDMWVCCICVRVCVCVCVCVVPAELRCYPHQISA